VPPPDIDAAGEHPVDEVVPGRDLGKHAADPVSTLINGPALVDTARGVIYGDGFLTGHAHS
jgi:hypothetical protein